MSFLNLGYSPDRARLFTLNPLIDGRIGRARLLEIRDLHLWVEPPAEVARVGTPQAVHRPYSEDSS